MGRRTSLTDLVAQQIVAAVKKGATREAAAKAAGVSRSTLQDWLARGEQGEEPYEAFATRVREAWGKVLVEVDGYILDIARNCEHPPTRLSACLNIVKRDTPQVTAKGASASEQRDPAADLDVVRATLRALESRAKVA